jgi:Transposase DDE domain group 1
MTRQLRRHTERKLKKIKIIPCNIKLTASSGLGTVLEIFDNSPLAFEFRKCLPERVSHRSAGSYFLGLMVMAGHIHGVEALADLAEIQDDPYLAKLFCDDVAAVRTIGDFLRDFTPTHIELLNDFLNTMSRTLFSSLQMNLDCSFKPRDLIIDMDSTYHEHFGEKIEGVAWNYKNEWSIETQVAFSNLGFCHFVQMRPGNTKSGTDAASAIERIFRDARSQLTRKREGLDYFRADSAYCHQEVFRSLLKMGVLFTVTANDATTHWKTQMKEEGLSWAEWIYSEEEKQKALKQERELPRVEVSRFFWRPNWSEKMLMFPIVVKRTWTPARPETQHDLFAPDTVLAEGEWDYYAVVTNLDLSRWSLQSVMEHHAKRGNAENFVKEEKYNFKLKNFPCQKLLANQAWVQFALIAHNMIRWIALMDAPDRPHYSKKIRRKYIFNAGKLVYHAGEWALRVMASAYERGMKNLREGWQFPAIVPAQLTHVPSG